jgi:acyl-CoA synthetase (AMP-forming)/AMP-acid ligase II
MPVGEIEVRCPFLFDGYFRNPAATAAAVTGGWLKTGDIGFLLDGELYVCGRAKEMLIVHGRNFYANDIEGLINTLAGIKPGRCVAVGVFDPVTGSEEAVVLAETVLTEDADRCELEQAIRKRVFDVLNLTLRRVDLAAEGALVKTTSGKISRDENVRRLKRELVPS